MKLKIITTTTNTLSNAKSISKALIDNKLTPCVQILPNILSIYRWNNKIINNNEFLMLIKSSENNLEPCKLIIEKYHNYDIPELIILDGDIIEDDYKTWFNEHSRKI